MPKSIFFRISFISWIVLVTFSSLFSFSEVDTGGIDIPHFDKIVHFAFYFGMVVLGVLASREQLKQRFVLKKALLGVLVFAVLYGMIIEVLQYSITVDREGDILDVFANTFGALVGMFLVRWLVYRIWPLK
ncbi:VanZ family protein [Maribacter sp. MMG018]|uniref:VanZ family protein n=1 Tax=Maribacter sp. MMG018 TaxID=2822688 RepID=UPI001B384DDC|nr:VanZ family protein [Maribacter sp. MMG018]